MSYAEIARRFLGAAEPIADVAFFAPEVVEKVSALGLEPWPVYFMGRAAPLGAVPSSVVASTFFNFSPVLVAEAVRWDIASPSAVLAARQPAILAALQRVLGTMDVSRAAALLREAVSACRPEGRSLFAAWTSVPWPSEDLLAVWQGATLLREYRGDGHIAVLVAHGLDAIDAILLHNGYRDGKMSWVLVSRAWGDEAYNEGIARLAKRGFVNPDGSLTDGGMKFREMIEMETDRVALPPFEHLGEEKSEELLSLLTPIAAAAIEAKAVPKFTAHAAKGVAPVAS